MQLVIVKAVCADIKGVRALSIGRPKPAISAGDRPRVRSDLILKP